MIPIVKAGTCYFALVFGAGFVLGSIRFLWVMPHVGTRVAELLEMPIMLGVVYVAARWVVRRSAVPPSVAAWLMVGCLALGLLLGLEFTVVLWLQGLTIRKSMAHRDPVAATAYAVSLVVFAVMPLLVARYTGRHAATPR